MNLCLFLHSCCILIAVNYKYVRKKRHNARTENADFHSPRGVVRRPALQKTPAEKVPGSIPARPAHITCY